MAAISRMATVTTIQSPWMTSYCSAGLGTDGAAWLNHAHVDDEVQAALTLFALHMETGQLVRFEHPEDRLSSKTCERCES